MPPKSMAKSKLPLSYSRQQSKRRRQDEKPLEDRPGIVKKVTPSATRTSWASLSPEEMSRAQALANITTNYQRPDSDLVEAMRKKQRQIVAATTHNISSTDSSTLSPTIADENIVLANDAHLNFAPMESNNSTHYPKGSNGYFDWEDKARQIIEREELSLDREWSRLSWKQKASNIVRLKLLKDDGYDVSPLMAKGTTSDQIIDALLAHVESRKQGSPLHSTSWSDRDSGSDFGAETDASSFDTRSSTPHDTLKEKHGLPSSISFVQSLDSSHAKPHFLAPEKRFYPTLPILSQKRKHTHEDDLQPAWHETQRQTRLHALYNKSVTPNQSQEPPCTCGASPPKLLRLLPPALVARKIQDQALDLLKWRICRSLFRSTREARTTSQAYSTITATSHALSVPRLVFTPRTPPKPSRILFTEHAAPGTKPSGSDVYMGSRAFGLIKREVQCLSWSYDAQDGNYAIHDHDADEAEANSERSFQHDICMSGPGDGYAAVLEGDRRALASLMKYLRSSELFHLGKWRVGDVREDAEGEGDVQMKIVVNEALPLQLSHSTDRVLEEVERRLGEGSDEVRVGVVQQCERSRCT